jgi:hypothetical protein
VHSDVDVLSAPCTLVIGALTTARVLTTTQTAAMDTLFYLVVRAPQEKLLLMTLGGLRLVNSAMISGIDSPEVQESGCALLDTLSVHQKLRVEMVSAGCMHRVIKAMEAHSTLLRVQTAACATLRNIAAAPDNRSGIATCGGPALLVDAMHRFMDCGELQVRNDRPLSLCKQCGRCGDVRRGMS